MRTIEERKVFNGFILGTAGVQAAAVRPILWITADAEDWKGGMNYPGPQRLNHKVLSCGSLNFRSFFSDD